MAEHARWETIKVEGSEVVEHVKELIHEGNVRRIVIRQDDRIIAEFPLTFGVIGALIAPVLAAVGAIAAIVKDCTIDIQRSEPVATAVTADSTDFSADEVVDM